MSADSSSEASTSATDRTLAFAWSPLRNGFFRSLWIATIVSNIGTWMQDVGAGWRMTSLLAQAGCAALRAAEKGYRVGLMEAGKRWKD
jgi:hypothetical protein